MRNIDSSRKAGDEAVLALTRLFGATARRLEATAKASQSMAAEISGEGGVLAVVDRCDADLRSVAATLKKLQVSKDAVLDEVRRYADLREMAGQVQHIAMQLRLLSFNAAVEAARAGEAGSTFAIVAKEMRLLAELSAGTGSQMAKKVELINASLAEIALGSTRSADADGQSIANADAAICDVMQRLKQLGGSLSRSVETLDKESGQVREEISTALVQLQFQDRVSQILSHVATSMGGLREMVENGSRGVIDAQAWVREMARGFSTHEEFQNLHGTQGVVQKSEQIIFFKERNL